MNLVQTSDQNDSLSRLDVKDMEQQVTYIQQLMKSVLKDNEHYGVIPGLQGKKILMKSGAEKLCFAFRLCPKFIITQTDLRNGHREYIIRTEIYNQSGGFLGEGVGSASTMESKYRYRKSDGINTNQLVPAEYWKTKNPDLLGGKGFSAKKVGSSWFIFQDSGEKAEYEDPADYYNTVLKMAKKRSHVDAVLTVTAASDIFTQDLDETLDPSQEVTPPKDAPKTESKSAAKKEPELPWLNLTTKDGVETKYGKNISDAIQSGTFDWSQIESKYRMSKVTKETIESWLNAGAQS